ncbi:hypothetical protein GCM10009748_08310 [Agromyces lapidis]
MGVALPAQTRRTAASPPDPVEGVHPVRPTASAAAPAASATAMQRLDRIIVPSFLSCFIAWEEQYAACRIVVRSLLEATLTENEVTGNNSFN